MPSEPRQFQGQNYAEPLGLAPKAALIAPGFPKNVRSSVTSEHHEAHARGTSAQLANRMLALLVSLLLGFGAIGARLADVMLINHDDTAIMSASSGENHLTRGAIVDRNGELLATNLITQSLFANPKLIVDSDETAQKLHAIFPELSIKDLTRKLKLDRGFIWLKRNLTPKQQSLVHHLGLPGLGFQQEERRVYPHGGLLAHVLGYVNTDNQGIAGVEKYFDSVLHHNDDPLQLSIDIRIQHILADEIEQGLEEFRAKRGWGVVVDVQTSEIVAMAALPSFDPNKPNTANPDNMFNPAALGVFEMGSTFKLLTAAMGLESGVVNLESVYDATRPLQVGRFRIHDDPPQNRWLNLVEILMYSSSIGTAQLALDIGTERQKRFLERLGMFEPLQLELPELGLPLVPKTWRDINTMTIGYGYGVAVTPLHLVNAVACLVNGGFRRQLTLTKVDASEQPRPEKRIFSDKTSAQIRYIMRRVVEEGTGKKAEAKGYLVAGKTSTRRKLMGKNYKKNTVVASFVSTFPAHDPKYVMLVMVDEPLGNEQTHHLNGAGWVAAPITSRIINRMAPIVGVRPVQDVANHDTPWPIMSVGMKKAHATHESR